MEMVGGRRITKPPPYLAPLLSVQFCQSSADLPLRPLSVAETSFWAKEGQRRLNLSGCRFGLHRRIEPLLRLAPCPPRLLRHPTGITSTVLAACYFGISLRRGLYELLRPAPLPMHDSLE